MHFVLILLLFAIYYISGGSKSNSDLKIRKQQVVLMGLCLFLFAALRSFDVGQDLPTYYDHYLNDSDLSIKDILLALSNRDPGFHIFVHFLSYVSSDPQLMLVAVGLIVSFGFSFFVYNEKGSVLLFFIMFIGFRLFSFTLSGLRQAVSLGIVFIAYVYLMRSKYVIYAVLTLIATLFHASAILFLLALPASMVNYKLLSLTLLGGAAINISTGGTLSRALASLFFEDRFANYAVSSFEGTTTFILYFAIYLICLLGMRDIKRMNKEAIMSMNLFTVGIFFTFLGQQLENVFRIAYYFIIAMYPAFSQFINNQFKKDQMTAGLIHLIICVLLSAQYLLFGTGAGTGGYTFFWQVSHY